MAPPFLLGLLLGRLIWGPYKSQFEDTRAQLTDAQAKIEDLEARLKACNEARTKSERDAALLRGRLRELEQKEAGTLRSKSKAKSGLESSGPVGPIPLTETEDRPPVDYGIYSAFNEDQLQVIEGIGPKMEEILKKAKINTWAKLADQSVDDLRSLLAQYGRRYQIIDPETWPYQAQLAQNGEWQRPDRLPKKA